MKKFLKYISDFFEQVCSNESSMTLDINWQATSSSVSDESKFNLSLSIPALIGIVIICVLRYLGLM